MDIKYNRGSKLHFCEDGKGQASGLVQIALDSNIRPTVRMEIQSGTSVSGKGVHSAVIKFTVPYIAVTETPAGGWVADAKKASTLSFHTVVNLPKPVVNDLLGLNGSVPQQFAAKQVAGAMDLFRSILPARLGGGFETALWTNQDPTSGTIVVSMLADRSYVFKPDEVNPEGQASHEAPDNVVETVVGPKVGENVVDYTNTTPVDVVSGPFARIIQRMNPLGCDDIEVPNTALETA